VWEISEKSVILVPKVSLVLFVSISHNQSLSSSSIINTIMDVVAAKKGGEFGFNLWPRKCAECLKSMT
jgi:hypothetical protein